MNGFTLSAMACFFLSWLLWLKEWGHPVVSFFFLFAGLVLMGYS